MAGPRLDDSSNQMTVGNVERSIAPVNAGYSVRIDQDKLV